jgi:hypothetical protein
MVNSDVLMKKEAVLAFRLQTSGVITDKSRIGTRKGVEGR